MSRHSELRKAGCVTVGEELLRLAKYMETREYNTSGVVYSGWKAGESIRRFERKYRYSLRMRIR